MHNRKEQSGDTSFDKDIDFSSGRIESARRAVRSCFVTKDLTFLDDLVQWKGISSVILIEASQEKDGIITNETRYYLSSKTADAKFFNTAVRNHWKIENSLHWQLDPGRPFKSKRYPQ